MTNIGIKSSQLSDIRAALLESSKNTTLEPKQTANFGNQKKDFNELTKSVFSQENVFLPIS